MCPARVESNEKMFFVPEGERIQDEQGYDLLPRIDRLALSGLLLEATELGFNINHLPFGASWQRVEYDRLTLVLPGGTKITPLTNAELAQTLRVS
ncbi:hypothetical protein A2363_01000 [Candidatus Gottesmanbacteria bacterium RIFOXYB1_FULL_47_11]|uniref:Uncharacterized protein n=1 Tax=Candidatus Gottesmanbacteria bacterium RIFOXYB1_FULL_47_11 TaxID=1798401 RepID=A0A1F6BGJ2_9BACT|nr:MAG: hypothetical protein A2363_01000 [Candidatus Gottesmanbacteria bacterium RIFOXYB1_FULL_47_11]